jgi:hypothetical protein
MAFANEKHESASADHPLAALPREDLDLVMELVLQSGSLKDLAAAYGVSYPTIRLRVDRVIERLKQAKAGRRPDPLSELLARMVERAELAPAAARSIRDVARRMLEAAAGERKGEVP